MTVLGHTAAAEAVRALNFPPPQPTAAASTLLIGGDAVAARDSKVCLNGDLDDGWPRHCVGWLRGRLGADAR